MMKVMTLRLPEETAEALGVIADIEAVPVTEVIRAAIDAAIAARRRDQRFQDSLKAVLDRRAQLFTAADREPS